MNFSKVWKNGFTSWLGFPLGILMEIFEVVKAWTILNLSLRTICSTLICAILARNVTWRSRGIARTASMRLKFVINSFVGLCLVSKSWHHYSGWRVVINEEAGKIPMYIRPPVWLART